MQIDLSHHELAALIAALEFEQKRIRRKKNERDFEYAARSEKNLPLIDKLIKAFEGVGVATPKEMRSALIAAACGDGPPVSTKTNLHPKLVPPSAAHKVVPVRGTMRVVNKKTYPVRSATRVVKR